MSFLINKTESLFVLYANLQQFYSDLGYEILDGFIHFFISESDSYEMWLTRGICFQTQILHFFFLQMFFAEFLGWKKKKLYSNVGIFYFCVYCLVPPPVNLVVNKQKNKTFLLFDGGRATSNFAKWFNQENFSRRFRIVSIYLCGMKNLVL